MRMMNITEMMKVNRLKKNKNGLYEILIENELLILDEETIIKYRLLEGKEISSQELSIIKLEDEINVLVNKSFDYAFRYKKSTNEVRRYLSSKDISAEIIDKVVNSLIERKLIDDYKLSKDIAASLARNSNGKLMIKEKLRQRLFNQSQIDDAIDNIDEQDYEDGKNKLIIKLERKYSKEEENIKKIKIKKQLYAHGYKLDD